MFKLHKVLPLTTVLVLASTGCIFGSPTSQIKEELRHYVNALNSAHPAEIARPFVFGAKANVKQWEKLWKREREMASRRSSSSPRGIEWRGVQNISVRGDNAQATVQFFWFTVPRQETLQLRCAHAVGARENTWQIVPRSSTAIAFSATQPLEQAAFFLAQGTRGQSLVRAKSEMRNLKNLTINLFSADTQSNSPLFSRKALMAAQSKTGGSGRYNASLRVGETREFYQFNTDLEGKRVADFSQAANKVLLYDGHARRLHLRYDGKGVVAFADGHIELLTQQQLNSKTW